MPRRTTLTYSSEDAPDVRSEQMYVYYCKCATGCVRVEQRVAGSA